MLVTETFHGYIETTQDVLLIFEGCRRGLLPRICRRLQEKERKMVQSGSVFVFDERESGIKRWTDGLVWSPSRILGNFLIYRELDKRSTGNGKRMSISGVSDSRQRSYSADHGSSSTVAAAGGVMSVDRNRERQLVGSLSDSYKFRKDGLIKKTMSIVVNGVSQHLISYYHPQDVLQNRLRTPSSVPELASLEISPELLVKQNFRIPPMVEPTFDQADALGGGGPMSPTDPLSAYGDRRSHPLRSMSLGSLRTPDHFHGNMIPRSDMSSPNMMYSYGNQHHHQNHRMDVEESQKQQSPPIPSYNNTTQQPVMYNGNVPPYQPPTMPSPSSMSSSPGTPMMSPVRPSFQQQQHHQPPPPPQSQHSHHSQPPPPHQRHYSVSSSSSGSLSSLSRMDPRSYEVMRPPQAPPTTTSTNSIHSPQPQSASAASSFGQVHPHMVQENNMGGFYNTNNNNNNNNGTGRMNDQQQHHHQDPGPSHSDHTKSNANIGQLLNPVHPLHNGHHQNGPSSTSSSIQPDSPHPTQQQQPMLMNPNSSYPTYPSPMNAAAAAVAAATSSSSASSSSTTPSSSVVPIHYETSKPMDEDTKMTHPHHTMCNTQAAAAENGTSGSGSGGGGGSGPSEYRYQEALTNTYSMMNYAPSPYQNGVLNPFTNDDTTGHDLSGPLMLK